MGFIVDKVVLLQVLSEYCRVPCSKCSFLMNPSFGPGKRIGETIFHRISDTLDGSQHCRNDVLYSSLRGDILGPTFIENTAYLIIFRSIIIIN
jgi:hypothetical protein